MSTALLLLALAHADIAPGRPLQRGPCDGPPTGTVCRTEQGLPGTCMASPPPSPQTGDSLGIGWIFPRCVPDDPDARAKMLRGEAPAPPAPAAPPPALPAPASPPPGGCGCESTVRTTGAGLSALLALAALRRRR